MEYKGYTIQLNEATGEFSLFVDSDCYFKSTNLIEVKAAIDKLVKKVFKRIPAYIMREVRYRYYSDEKEVAYTEVEITSISPDGDIWIIDKEKNREKNSGGIFKRNAKNLEILKEIKAQQSKVAMIEKGIDSLKKKLEPIECHSK